MGCRTRARHRQKKKKIHAWQTRKYKINYRRRNDSTLWSNAAASFSRRKKDACKRTGTIFQRVLRSAPPQNYDFTNIPNYISTGRLAPLFFFTQKRRESQQTTPHAKERGGKRKTPIETPETVATSQPAREIRAADVFIPTKKHSLQYAQQSVLQRCKYKGIRRRQQKDKARTHTTHISPS